MSALIRNEVCRVTSSCLKRHPIQTLQILHAMTDRYEIVSQLGEDVLGSVYLADDTMLQRRVMFRHVEYGDNPVVATRGDSWRKDFGTYAGKLSTMQHPNMLTIYDISIEESGAFVVTQFVQGESLAERLEQGPLGQLGVHRMAADMLEALHAAHQSDVFHGALHTGSIKRVHRATGGHRYLLVDLGLNQLTSMVRAEKVKVADPILMAPELHKDDHEPDAKADLFMLGQLCYTALVGGHPFSDKTTEECLEAYSTDGMPPLEDYVEGVNPEFSAWVMRLLEYDPEDRPEDTGAAMVDLHTIQLDEPEPNVPGRTHAVDEQQIPTSTTAPVVAVVQPDTGAYAGVSGATGSVHIAAANSATRAAGGALDLTQGHVVNGIDPMAGAIEDHKKKEKMMYILAGVTLLLISGLFIGLMNRGGKDQKEAQSEEVVNEHSIQIEKGVMVNTVAKQGSPVVVDLDGDKSLDWLVAAEIPSALKRIDKVDGLYIQSLQLVDAQNEHSMLANPIRFKSGGKVIFPKAATNEGKGSKPGAGYEVQLRIPAKETQSISVSLYVVQKLCDIRVEVSDPRSDEVKVKVIPSTEEGVIKVPILINKPEPGDFYIIKVVSTSAAANGAFMIGLSGVQIERQ